MSQKSKYHILRQPWLQFEDIIQSIAEKRWDMKSGNNNAMESLLFLVEIKIIETNSINVPHNIKPLLTPQGEDFYKNRFIYNDEGACKRILKNLLEGYEPVQIICQLLWGRDKLNKNAIYRLLLLKECIDYTGFKSEDLSSFLMLLNQCDILSYSKKTGQIKILFNPKTNETKEQKKMFLSPEARYTNIKYLWSALRRCSEYIYWVDKHFSAKGLEPLSEEADATKIREIKILSGPSNINDKLKRDFIRLKEELKSRGINMELRVIKNDNLLRTIHGRWIISKGICFNTPPINSIYQGQYDEIKETENIPPFEEWWNQGVDMYTVIKS
jgi:hypothetical protein